MNPLFLLLTGQTVDPTPGPGPGGGGGTGTGLITFRAYDFTGSQGVNVHPLKTGTAYNTGIAGRTPTQQMVYAFNYLGIRHARDVIHVGSKAQRAVWRAMYEQAGVRVLFNGGDLASNGTLPAGSAVAAEVNAYYSSYCDGVEGSNEPDLHGGKTPNWVQQTKSLQAGMWSGLHNVMPVGTPPIGSASSSDSRAAIAYGYLGDMTAVVSFNSIHPYPGAGKPATNLARHTTYSKEMAGNLPVWSTEDGYHNAVNTTDGHRPVPTSVSAVYLPRLFADHFRRGIVRTYLYELVDEKPDGSLTNKELHFGLWDAAWNAKPAAIALARMNRLLGDSGTTFTPSNLPAQITGPADMQYVSLQKTDTSYWLLLWRDVSVWNSTTGAGGGNPITVSPSDATVTLTSSATVSQYDVVRSDAPFKGSSGLTHTVSLAGDLIICQIGF